MNRISAAHVRLTFRYDPDRYLEYCRNLGEEPTPLGFLNFVSEVVSDDLAGTLPAGHNDIAVHVSTARRCRHCAVLLHLDWDLDAWVDDSGGDRCPGQDTPHLGDEI